MSDLNHRHKFFVILLHNDKTSDALKQAAHTSVVYEEFVRDLPVVYPYLPNVSLWIDFRFRYKLAKYSHINFEHLIILVKTFHFHKSQVNFYPSCKSCHSIIRFVT